MNAASFHAAIRSHDLATVVACLAEHTALTCATMELAAKHASAAIMHQIVQSGRGDPLCLTATGDSLCHLAIRFNEPDVLAALLTTPALPWLLRENFSGDSMLSEAAKSPNVRFIELLLSKIDDISSFNADRVRSPLHVCASQCENPDVAKRMIARGANVDVRDKFGATPLLLAVRRGHLSVAQALIGAGARLDCVDDDRRSLAIYAAQRSDVRFLTLLLDAGVDCTAVDRNLKSPLHVAAANENDAVLAALLATGKLDVNAADDVGLTPCHVAASQANERLIRLLIGAGCRLDATDTSNTMPIHLAAMNSNEAVISALVDAGADLNKVDNSGATPALRAASNSNERVIAVLVRAGADLNQADRFGRAPCHRAVANANERVLLALMESRAVVWDAQDRFGNNVWTAAVTNENECALRILFRIDEAAACVRRGHNNRLKVLPWFEAYARLKLRALEFMVSMGVDLDAEVDERTLLFHMVKNGDVEQAILLVAGGAELSVRDQDACIQDATTSEDTTTTFPCDEMVVLWGVISGADSDPRQTADERARMLRRIAATQMRLVRQRAFEVLVALQPLELDALRTCEILALACGPVGTAIPFHKWWALATLVKHFHKSEANSA